MEKEPHERPAPPPFDPDPELITNLEGGRKPTPEEVRKMVERAERAGWLQHEHT